MASIARSKSTGGFIAWLALGLALLAGAGMAGAVYAQETPQPPGEIRRPDPSAGRPPGPIRRLPPPPEELPPELDEFAPEAPGEDAPPADPAAGAARLDAIEALYRQIDPALQREANRMTLTLEGVQVTLIADPASDRMRLLAAVAPQASLTPALLTRLMQANYDSALDARYAIANGVLWSAFIHPLSPLTDRQALDGLAQTVTLALNFGSSFSSGALVFGGGDRNAELLEELLRRQQRQEKPDGAI